MGKSGRFLSQPAILLFLGAKVKIVYNSVFLSFQLRFILPSARGNGARARRRALLIIAGF